MFASRLGEFDPILGQPTGAGLTWLHKYLTKILLPILYDVEEGDHNLIGLVMDKKNYKQRYWAKIPMPTNPEVYDETVLNISTHVVWAKAESVHTAKISDDLLFAADKRETCNFILAFVDNRWVWELCEPVTFYTAVSLYELLYHLQNLCGGIHSLNVLALKN